MLKRFMVYVLLSGLCIGLIGSGVSKAQEHKHEVIQQEPVFVGKCWEDCVEYIGIVLEERYYRLETEHYIHQSNSKISHALVFNRDQLFFFLIKGNHDVWIACGEELEDKKERWSVFKVNKKDSRNPFTLLYEEMLDELKEELVGSNHGTYIQIMFGGES